MGGLAHGGEPAAGRFPIPQVPQQSIEVENIERHRHCWYSSADSGRRFRLGIHLSGPLHLLESVRVADPAPISCLGGTVKRHLVH
jgi:hypothetical protein